MKRIREDGLPKPRALTPTVKRLIVYRATTQRQVPREYLANELIKEINQAREKPPSLETIKRYISKARNVRNPIDEPWTLASCSQYPAFFPPESIPIIIYYKDCLSQLESDTEYKYKEFFGVSMSDISIRCAIWIIRLQPIIEHLSPKLMIEDEPLPSTYPFVIASTYAMAEMASEILGEAHFDSYDLDNALFSGDIRAFMLIAAKMFMATAKPCKNNNNCDSCDYVKLPSPLQHICVPKRKDGSK
jgi:hypothetical protein